MNCQSCNRPLTDDEIYVCDECVNEYPYLEVMEIVKGEGDGELTQRSSRS
ncbi:protein NinF [Proteus mirabilis]|nr:hypothetical protein [Proteus mirabilis]RQW16533.1 hypothetical protein EHQ54_05630 [Proteus mirabilis]